MGWEDCVFDQLLQPCHKGSHKLSSEDLPPFMWGGCCYTRLVSISVGWMLLQKIYLHFCGVDAVTKDLSPFLWGGCCYKRFISISVGWMLLQKIYLHFCGVDAVTKDLSPFLWGGCCYKRFISISARWMLLPKTYLHFCRVDAIRQGAYHGWRLVQLVKTSKTSISP